MLNYCEYLMCEDQFSNDFIDSFVKRMKQSETVEEFESNINCYLEDRDEGYPVMATRRGAEKISPIFIRH
jgi:hypothetical protein